MQRSRIEESMIVALHSPQHVVNANERNSPLKELCLVLYTNIVCKDLQQLYDRVGSQSTSAPIKAYIRKIPDITLYMYFPLGTLRPVTPPLWAASDPVRSYLSSVQFVRSRALALIFVGRLHFAKA